LGVEVMDHVCEGVACFSAFRYHPFHGFPGIAVGFHGGDDFEYGLHLFNILLDEFGLASVGLLFLD
jgi:hypothetical protein